MKLTRTLLMAGLAGLCFSASAQWQWIDKDGRKVFSDRPPPADIQEKNILKRPGGQKPVPLPAADAATDAEASASAPAAAPALPVSTAKGTGLDKELEAKKKQAQEAQAAKRKEAEEKIAKAKSDNCARAKAAKTAYESGVRISKTNAAGERGYLSDEERAQEIKRFESIIASDCQ